MAFHKQLWLRETEWEEEEVADYLDYLADFHAEFQDLRSDNVASKKGHADVLPPVSYAASQALAAELLQLGSTGIVYPSVRRSRGTCIACFRPVLVTNVRRGEIFAFVFSGWHSPPVIRRTSEGLGR